MVRGQSPQTVGTWAASGPLASGRVGAASATLEDGRTLIAGGTVAGNAKGSGKLFLRPDGKTIDKLNFQATSTARSKVTVDFVADNSTN